MSGRGPDVANAVVVLGVWLSIPIAGSVAFVAFDLQPDAWWLLVLWAVGLSVGPQLAWEAWHSLLEGRSLRFIAGQHQLSGRTPWPIRRRRSIRLDELTHVSYRMLTERHGFTAYFILHDRRGGRVMLEDAPVTRAVVLTAVSQHPGARVGYFASRRLAGMFTWSAYLLALLGLLAGALAAASGISTALAGID